MTMADLTELVEMRLLTFGYTPTEADRLILGYVAGRAAQYVCTFCNFPRCPDDIPDSLRHVTADHAVGEFLRYKKVFAPGDLSDLKLDLAVKQITTGDTTTVFATGDGSQTDEQKLDSLISYLVAYGKHELYSHRRVKW